MKEPILTYKGRLNFIYHRKFYDFFICLLIA